MQFKTVFILTVSIVSTPLYAIKMPSLPVAPVYMEPATVEASPEVRQQSCVQIDNAIRYLQPYRYSYKPGFFEDSYNKAATGMLATGFLPGAAYLLYSGLVEDKEQRRMVRVEQKIAMLQQAKAEKHCFE